MYGNLDTYLQSQLVEINSAAGRRGTDEIPIFYFREWKRYRAAMRFIQITFAYQDRHWIGREQDYREQNYGPIYKVQTLSLLRWRQDFVDREKRIVPSVLTLVERHRNREAVETSLIKTVVDSFVLLSVEKAENSEIMDTYRSYFEKPFLEATRAFYRAESERVLAESSILEYMMKVSYLRLSMI